MQKEQNATFLIMRRSLETGIIKARNKGKEKKKEEVVLKKENKTDRGRE
jgi:hypothetical protein